MSSSAYVKRIFWGLIYGLIPFFIMVDGGITSIPAWLTFIFLIYLIDRLYADLDKDFLYASVIVFFYIFLFVSPIMQVSEGSFPWYDFYHDEDIETCWWIVFVALVSFEFGHRLPVSRMTSEAINYDVSRLGYYIFFYVSILTVFVGVLLNGYESLFLPRNVNFDANDSSVASVMINSGILRVPAVFVLILFAVHILNQNKQLVRTRYRHQFLMFFILFVIVLTVNNLISTPRFWVGAIVFSLYMAYLVSEKKGAFHWFALNVAILVFLFPVMDVFRDTLEGNLFHTIGDFNPTSELISNPDFDAFQQQINTVVYVNKFDFQYGLQLFSSLLFFVPRAIWESKSEASGVLVSDGLRYDFFNVSTPIPAELYIDYGYIGVALGMFLLGFIYKKITILYRQGNILYITLYCFLCSYQVYFFRGSLMAVIPFLFIFLVCFYLSSVGSSLLLKKSLSANYMILRKD